MKKKERKLPVAGGSGRGKHPYPRNPTGKGKPVGPQGPRDVTKDSIGIVLVLLRAGVPVRTAVNKARLGKTTFYDCLKRGETEPVSVDGDLLLDVDEAVADYHIRTLKDMHEMALENRDPSTYLKILERRFKEEYSTSSEITHTLKVDDPFEGKTEEECAFYAANGHFPDEPPLTSLKKEEKK